MSLHYTLHIFPFCPVFYAFFPSFLLKMFPPDMFEVGVVRSDLMMEVVMMDHLAGLLCRQNNVTVTAGPCTNVTIPAGPNLNVAMAAVDPVWFNISLLSTMVAMNPMFSRKALVIEAVINAVNPMVPMSI